MNVSDAMFRSRFDDAIRFEMRVDVLAFAPILQLELGVDVCRWDHRPRVVFACVRVDHPADECEVTGWSGVDEFDAVGQFDAKLFDVLFGADAAFGVDEFPFVPAFGVSVVFLCGSCEV
jgi:hypothetical protein